LNRKLLVVLPVSMILTWGIWAQKDYYDRPVIAMSEAAADTGSTDPQLTTTASEADAFATEDVSLSYPLRLASLNGISLSDDLKTIYEIKGEPLRIVEDEIFKSSRTYVFQDCTIGMTDGAVKNIVVPVSAIKIEIDGQTIPLELERLKEKLGTPFFISEDGIVYKDGDYVIKIYLDNQTGLVHSVSYFHSGLQ
jgi:hypothetical protein